MTPLQNLAVAMLAAVLLMACGANVIGAESEPSEQELEMAVGETLTLDEGCLQLTFEGVPFDNRCPQDVQCIVAGTAKVTLLAKVAGKEEHQLTLELGARGPQTVDHEGYSLRLLAVDPYPVSTRQIKPQDYRVRLQWER